MHLKKGDYKQALENFNKCLEIQKKILGPEPTDFAINFSKIGVVYYSKGDYE